MGKLTTVLDGVEYPLATTLRVAYVVQGQHNHKAYTEVFQGIGDMTLEDQIRIIYAAFKVANKEQVFVWTDDKFVNYYLDNYGLKQVMNQLQDIIQGIMGVDTQVDATAATTSEDSTLSGN